MSAHPMGTAEPRRWSSLLLFIVTASALVIGGVSGGVTAFYKNQEQFPFSFLHKVLVLLTIVLPLVSLFVHRRQTAVQAVVALTLEALAMWMGVFIGYQAFTNRPESVGTLLEVAILYWLLVCAVAAIIAAGIHWRNHPRLNLGPWCPACGYHLVGITQHMCPECGRAFTLEELGIDESELRPPDAT